MSRRGRWTRQNTWNLDWNKPKWSWWEVHPFYSTEGWHALRGDVLKRDGGICLYCGGFAQTADHVIPRGAGGGDSMDNLVASCIECNRIAGGRVLGGFARKRAWIPRSRGIWFEGDYYH